MYSGYHDREELEDDLYQEDDASEASDANSELEFHLYSQLHYSSNAGEMVELEAGEEEDLDTWESQQADVLEKTTDGDPEQKSTKQSKPTSSNDHLNTKKVTKKKKGKIKVKGQKLSSSHFEEVIVIPSSPGIISISDNDSANYDDNVGVCALKGQRSRLRQTSTPAQQLSQKRKRSPFVPVVVLSSTSDSSGSQSESEPSDSSDSTDVDDLENWMILGQGRQDGDQSISLNVEGGSYDSGTEADERGATRWIVSEKDKEAQIYNKGQGPRIAVPRLPHRYYTGKNVQCRNCNKTGHLSKNCPDPRKLTACFLCGTTGHQASQCPNKHCNNCGQPGHLFNSCNEKAYWHKQCHRCSMRGHFFDACPEIWRQYHITTKKGAPVKQQGDDSGQSPVYCYNCSKKGHYGYECTQQRMFSGVFPTYPFVNYYDTLEDISRRQHKIRLKVKALAEKGRLSAASPAPPTPGPPKKKQKVNHHKDSPHQKLRIHQIPNNYSPRPSHIIFNDDDFNDVTPKTKTAKRPQNGGSSKPWKPKRPVPTTRDAPPVSKLVVDEADDFPRGGGPQQDKEQKMKRRRKHRTNKVDLSMAEGQRDWSPDRFCSTGGEWSRGPKSKNQSGEKKKRRKRAHKGANKQAARLVDQEEDNLFLIKQRKRSR
ncbi:zinc finger CCHC domain-containing protein 7 [Fundulus heteroclitus]|uniref:zinc finger CCHC domain-containing protein 7 n=1 Tax=Fundulus heteroclitus TaxID=8078 RepID=UPI00165B9B88|nr:zinc finger CCHC domain-containing protein 7 [Fundulus heteroclitus]XP_035992821.1 zinc finger CCHC domain-containing protein 7 [Fundulus heteroclitus]XP_035992822.1 zinc finger CCHC domain-containing protein 7 [Fundulus heteroclitus]XP_035992823.1 zinc finger CCHC domain-containing protein 7 [Fundulus heteroclitus]